jgi:hypothetical protein
VVKEPREPRELSRDRWKREGKCVRCGHERDVEGKLNCAVCLQHAREVSAQRRAAASPAAKSANALSLKERRDQRRAAGLCPMCGGNWRCTTS